VIDHLPASSHYYAAMLNDPEYAQAVIESQDRAKREGREISKSGPSLATWTSEVGVMADIVDALRRVEVAVFAAAGGNPKDPVPYARPRTALDQARKQKEQADYDALVARMLPTM